jgi:hypothetical protein
MAPLCHSQSLLKKVQMFPNYAIASWHQSRPCSGIIESGLRPSFCRHEWFGACGFYPSNPPPLTLVKGSYRPGRLIKLAKSADRVIELIMAPIFLRRLFAQTLPDGDNKVDRISTCQTRTQDPPF